MKMVRLLENKISDLNLLPHFFSDKHISSIKNKLDDGLLFFDNVEEILPENCLRIDSFPLVVSDPEAHNQLEIFYDDADTAEKIKLYDLEEAKFLNVIKKIWAYNLTFLGCDIQEIDMRILKEHLPAMDPYLLTLLKEKYTKEPFKNIRVTDLKQLELAGKLALRDKILAKIFFTDFKLIFWVQGLYIACYMGNPSYKELLNKICTTEGLYSR